ncbi:MAG TPA: hypothetical protein VMF58_06885 [Rhizomicrobium sp.]|nr:hypothetical protein [Rhizomicrobium sp.]
MIDLSCFRVSAGSIWGSIQDAVRTKFETILRQRLAPTDSFERIDETRYLIVTPQTAGDDGAIFAVRIAHEMAIALNGRCEFTDLRVETVKKSGPSAIACRPMRSETLAALIDKAQIPEVVLPAHLRGRLRTQTSDTEPNRAGNVRRSQLSVAHQFEPVWNVHREAISTYLCTPKTIVSANSPGIELNISDLDLRERTNVELSCIQTGVKFLSRNLESGDRFLLGLPISFETLCSPYGRMEFAGLCRGLPAVYRQYLVFAIVEVPSGVTHSRLTDIGMVLRPFGRIIATVASGCRNYSAYDGHGFMAIALDLAQCPPDAERRRADIVQVAAAARFARFGTMVMNVEDSQTLSIANAADVQLLHGAAIAPPSDSPRRMTHLPASNVIPQEANAGAEEWF